MIFYPGAELGEDHTNWWGSNRACVEAMLTSIGFREVRFTANPHLAGARHLHAYR
jgi:hypothetical protein